ncbi:MAG: hypothetical protein JNK82_41915 [Myxococcaceae bacterium]|nr:hypothetical protein [Myxococcaceae bacterium]
MLASVVTLFLAQALGSPLADHEKIDLVRVVRGPDSLDLEWTDNDDRLRGAVRPLEPMSGRPVELSVLVGTFQGDDFDGPVTMTMRCEAWSETQTVRRARGEKAWGAKFVPVADGEDCTLDFGFTTTRYKRLHTKVWVQAAPLARWPWFVILGLGAAIALGLGVRAIFKKPENA